MEEQPPHLRPQVTNPVRRTGVMRDALVDLLHAEFTGRMRLAADQAWMPILSYHQNAIGHRLPERVQAVWHDLAARRPTLTPK